MNTQSISYSLMAVMMTLVLSANASAMGRKGTAASPSPETGSLQPAHEVYDGPITVHLDALNGFDGVDQEKVGKAARILETVFNSTEFRNKVLSKVYNGATRFADDTGLTNEQILHKITAGEEIYTQTEDHVANFELALYSPPFYKKWSVVGYTTPGQPVIHMNANYFNQFTPNDIAGNMAHEWCHKIGFDHDFNRTARRPDSVPYSVGQMVIDISHDLGL